MIWSFSDGRTFRRCQRQWYFKKCLGSATSKDELRREAYLLGKLSSVHGWRGKIVDQVIDHAIIPIVRDKKIVVLRDALKAADELFKTQLAFALAHKIMEPGFKASEHSTDYAAFFGVQYGKQPTEAELDKAKAEVHKALRNLFLSTQFKDLRRKIKSADSLVAQCPISFPFAGATIRGVPDLICLFKFEPPIIIDWKVHHFGVHDYYQQLVAYAIILIRSGEHAFLPRAMRSCVPHEIRLFECQLLTDEIREHKITQDDIDAVEQRMADEIYEMLSSVDGQKNKDLSADDFPTTNWPGACATCNYQKICIEPPQTV